MVSSKVGISSLNAQVTWKYEEDPPNFDLRLWINRKLNFLGKVVFKLCHRGFTESRLGVERLIACNYLTERWMVEVGRSPMKHRASRKESRTHSGSWSHSSLLGRLELVWFCWQCCRCLLMRYWRRWSPWWGTIMLKIWLNPVFHFFSQFIYFKFVLFHWHKIYIIYPCM